MTNQTIYNQWKTLFSLVFLLSAFNSDAKEFTCELPIISIPDTVEVCSGDSGIDSLCINFETLAVGSTGTWTQNEIIPSFNFSDFPLDSVCFEGIQVGCYPFTFTTNTAEPPCVDTMATMIVCVKVCPCPSPATMAIPEICNLDTYNLENVQLSTDPGTWSIISGPAYQDTTGIITDKTFNAIDILPGDYVVRFTLDNPGGPACEVFSEQTITVFKAPTVIAVNGTMCNIDGQSDPIVLDLYTLVSVDASDGGSWTQIGTPMVSITGADMSTIMSSDLATFPEILIFEYTSGIVAGSPCPPTVVTVEVLVKDCSCPFVNVLADTLCNNGMAIDLNTLLENPDGLSGTWTTTGTLVGASMFDPNGLPSGLYLITFTLDSSPDPTCDLEYTNTILVRKQPVAEPAAAEPPCSVDSGIGQTTSNLYDWLESGYTSGYWEQTGGDILPLPDDGTSMAIVDFEGQDIGEAFTYVFITNGAQYPCTDISVQIIITVVDCNCTDFTLTSPPAISNVDGVLDLCSLVSNADIGTFTVFSQGGENLSANIDLFGCNFDATGIAPGIYSIIYTLDEQVPSICVQADTAFLVVIEVLSSNTIIKNNIQIYPNPTSDILRVKSDYKITLLNIYSTTGKSKYKSQSFNDNNVEIDLSQYPSGLYLLQVETGTRRWVEKVIRK